MFDYPDFNQMFFVEMVYSLYHRAAISTRHQETDGFSFTLSISRHAFGMAFSLCAAAASAGERKGCFYHETLALTNSEPEELKAPFISHLTNKLS